jgi:hypothetical protein
MRSTTTSVKTQINEHILSYFEPDMYGAGDNALDNLKDQLKSFDYMSTDYQKGLYMAEGGTFLIYTYEMTDFLNSLGINPDNKQYDTMKVFSQYCHLIARQVQELVK